MVGSRCEPWATKSAPEGAQLAAEGAGRAPGTPPALGATSTQPFGLARVGAHAPAPRHAVRTDHAKGPPGSPVSAGWKRTTTVSRSGVRTRPLIRRTGRGAAVGAGARNSRPTWGPARRQTSPLRGVSDAGARRRHSER